jgi:plastocyanin
VQALDTLSRSGIVIRRIVCAASVAAVVVSAVPAGAQSVLERTPNIAGAWVSAPGTVNFNFTHRFYLLSVEQGQDRILNVPTFLFGYSAANLFLFGAQYSSSSRSVRDHPNEWEYLIRYAPLRAGSGLPFELGFTAAYNDAAQSFDGEVSAAAVFGGGRAKVLGSFRALSSGFGSDSARAAVAGGARLKLTEHFGIAGDVVTPLSKRDTEVIGWGAALQMEIPNSPHSFSLQATNTTTQTLQGSSRGVPKAGGAGGGTRWGFEFTVPITLSRYFGGGAGNDVTITADTARVEIRDNQFAIQRLVIRPGTTVVWVNQGNLPHTATSDNGVWNSPLLSRGESYSRVFNEPGEFAYHCTPHPFMTAVIVVQNE